LILFYTQLGYYGQFLFQQWQMKEAAREAWIAALPDAALFRVRLSDVNAQGNGRKRAGNVGLKIIYMI